MKVILKETVPKLGNKNDVVEVSDGFAINSLIPSGKAVPATKQALVNLENQKQNHKEDLKNEAREWMKVKEEIESKEFVDFAKTKDGIIINNITRKHAMDILNKNLSIKINKKQLQKDYLFSIGVNEYEVELFPHIIAIAKIVIKEK